jgi:2-hydroxychromene-2-carboxylate isomerase
MADQLDFYFDFRSPYSYLAFTQLGSLPAPANLMPISVLDVMKLVGNTPTTVTCEAKGRYARRDLQRWARRYGVPVTPRSDVAKIDGKMLLRAVLASASVGALQTTVETLFFAFWRDAADLSAEGCRTLFRRAGLPADEILGLVNDQSTIDTLKRNDQRAAERGVFGTPTFFVGGDMYFGNDRLDFVRDRLAAERPMETK